MDEKSWYLSKGIWGGLLAALGVGAKVYVTGQIEAVDITYFGIALGLLGIRFKQSSPTEEE